MKCPYSILWYVLGTKWALIDWISGLYSKVPIAWPRVVLCSSIQFPRDLIKNLLTSFSRSVLKLRHLFFFFFLIYGPGASQSGHKLKWKEKLNPVRNLQYGPRTRLVRGVYSSLDLNLWLQLWRKKKERNENEISIQRIDYLPLVRVSGETSGAGARKLRNVEKATKSGEETKRRNR